MHIPNGFMDAKMCAATFALAGASVALAARAVAPQLDRKKLTAMGAMSAFLLLAQMANFPIAGGTSGHLLGGVLAAMLLRPAAAVLVMSAVLVVQCVLFHDGGTMALGANILNMAVIAPLFGTFILDRLQPNGSTAGGRVVSAAVAAWASVMASACACSIELALSGTSALGQVLPTMTFHHAQIGIGESLITAGCVFCLLGLRTGNEPTASRITGGALLASGVALVLSLVSSQLPDGLEATAAALHFDSLATISGVSQLTGFLVLTAGLTGAAAAFLGARFAPAIRTLVSIKR